MARATRDGRPLGLAMLDLDHFKDYTTSMATRPVTSC
jgi:PleD family two-component response regulator